MPKEIKVLVDTSIVEENTKDSLQVKLVYENDVTGKYEKHGVVITGDNMKEVTERVVNLGNLKQQVNELEEQIAQLIDQKEQLNLIISQVEPELDKAIQSIKDKKTPVEEVAESSIQ